MPESLRTLQDRSNQYKEEEAKAAAAAEEAARLAAEAEIAALAKETKAKEEAAAAAAAAAAQETLQQETARTGSTTPPDVVMRPIHDGKNGSIKSHPHDSAATPLSRTQKNQIAAPTMPPPVPSTSRPKYAAYGDDEDEDDRGDPVPVPDYRPVVNNFSNGIDRHSKKRVNFRPTFCLNAFFVAIGEVNS